MTSSLMSVSVSGDYDINEFKSFDYNTNVYNKQLSVTKPSKEAVVFSVAGFSKPTRIHEIELEWWLGNVSHVSAETFTAVLEDLSGRKNVVEFEIDMLEETDRELLYEGSMLTYSISSFHDPGKGHGGIKYITKLSFSGKRRWYENYEAKASALVDDLFPTDIYLEQ